MKHFCTLTIALIGGRSVYYSALGRVASVDSVVRVCYIERYENERLLFLKFYYKAVSLAGIAVSLLT